MKAYDFNAVIDRRNTNSLKYDFAVERGLPEDVLPLWVADMDFRTADPVLAAMHRAVDHGIFGYSEVKGEYYAAVARWFRERHGWQTEESWLVKTPGVVVALALAVRALTEPGDSVLVQPPVYYPFYAVTRENGRKLVENELVYENGRYFVDFADFEQKIVENNVKLFILCSPHNPVGRVWTREELERIGRICKKHGVFVVSDEIHCDFAFPEHPHTMFLVANPDMKEQAMVCTAPSKSFNLAGMQVSNIWIPGENVRRKFCREMEKVGLSEMNTLGLVACQAAYTDGAEWLDQCRAYMRGNLDFLRDFLKECMPEIRLVEPEGTYFAWLDCSGLGITREELNDLIVNKAKLWLDAGHIFGECAWAFQRVVLACTRDTLQEALRRLERAVKA